MPRAKGMFVLGMLGMLGMLGAPEGFWGATGSLGNLASAASISSLLIVAFVAALTCLGAIRILYHCLSSLPDGGELLPFNSSPQRRLQLVFCRFPTNWESVRGSEVSQRITQIRNTDFPATPSPPEAWQLQPHQKALELP